MRVIVGASVVIVVVMDLVIVGVIGFFVVFVITLLSGGDGV